MGAESSRPPAAAAPAPPRAPGGRGALAEAPWLPAVRRAIEGHPGSLRFHRAGLLGYDERLEDGFLALFARELLRVDAEKDPVVRGFLGFARGCLPPDDSAAFSPASRVVAVARAVGAALGGAAEDAPAGGGPEERWDARFRELDAGPPRVLPLGALFAAGGGGAAPPRPGAGLQRHRAVLLKYVCDQLHICYSALVDCAAAGVEGPPGAPRGVVNVAWVDGHALAVDLLEEPGRLVEAAALHRLVVKEAEGRLGPRPFARLRAAGAPPAAEAATEAAAPAEAPAALPRSAPPPPAGAESAGARSLVEAYVYDISEGVAAKMSPLLLGKRVDIVPHTGIVAFGKEYFFGNGPCIGEPGKTVPLPVGQVLTVGETTRTREELEQHIRSTLAREHTPEKYNLLTHNCNHFAEDVARYLVPGGGLPASIVRAAEEALSTPEGQGLRSIIEEMERSARSGATADLNPFG